MNAKTPHSLRATMLSAALLALAGLLSACHIWIEDENSRESWTYCDAHACYLCDAAGCALPGDVCYDDDDCGGGTCDDHCRNSGGSNQGREFTKHYSPPIVFR